MRYLQLYFLIIYLNKDEKYRNTNPFQAEFYEK